MFILSLLGISITPILLYGITASLGIGLVGQQTATAIGLFIALVAQFFPKER